VITDKKLMELGFRCYQVNTLMYFEKDDVKLEKIYNGYLCTRPHKVVKTIKQLKELL